MSSAVYLSFISPVSLEEWQAFCREQSIEYRPSVIGRNAFYVGEVEITFGENNWAPLAKSPSGYLDFDAACPFPQASDITVSTFWMGKAIPDVARIAQSILARWPGTVECDPELERFFPNTS